MHELKPCPFCGGAAVLSSSHGWSGIGCRTDKCPAYLTSLMFRTEAAALAVWNRRSTDGSLAAAKPGARKYDDVLLPFLSLMRKELHANSSKGDRPGWLRIDPNTALLEVYWHAAKLSVAVKNNDGPAIQEHSADVANMAMMVLDVCRGLAFVDNNGLPEDGNGV